MSPRTGRPRVSEEDRRKVFPIRISGKERQLYESAAQKAGIGIQAWIRSELTTQANLTLGISKSGAGGIWTRNSDL